MNGLTLVLVEVSLFKMIFRSLLLAGFVLFSSCSQDQIDNVGIFPFILNGQAIDLVGISEEAEDGLCEYYVEDDLLMSGNLRDGQKLGVWKYSLPQADLSLDWSIYTEKSGRFSFSYPSVWKIEGEVDDIDLKMRTSDENKNLQIVIYEHELDSVELKTYFEDYLVGNRNNYGDLDAEAFRFSVNGTERYYIKLNVSGGKIDYVFHGFLFKGAGKIYDITYITKAEDERIWEVIFFDLLYSFHVNGIRLLPPFSEYFVEPLEINEGNIS